MMGVYKKMAALLHTFPPFFNCGGFQDNCGLVSVSQKYSLSYLHVCCRRIFEMMTSIDFLAITPPPPVCLEWISFYGKSASI
jgi:hypothetical protein